MFPYFDVQGFRLRSIMPAEYIDSLELNEAGWLQQCAIDWTNWLHDRLRKRYGAAAEGNALPFGQSPPPLVAAGTTPPSVTLVGRPVLGCLQILINITTPGALGVAAFQWSLDRGKTLAGGGLLTASTVSLAGTGMSAVFPSLPYASDNVYAAGTPVPGTVLKWLASLMQYDAMQHLFRNSQDPALVSLKETFDRVMAEVKEAADGKDGLFDLPVNEDSDSAVTTGGPLGYSEQSPYVWTTQQARGGGYDDQRGRGS